MPLVTAADFPNLYGQRGREVAGTIFHDSYQNALQRKEQREEKMQEMEAQKAGMERRQSFLQTYNAAGSREVKDSLLNDMMASGDKQDAVFAANIREQEKFRTEASKEYLDELPKRVYSSYAGLPVTENPKANTMMVTDFVSSFPKMVEDLGSFMMANGDMDGASALSTRVQTFNVALDALEKNGNPQPMIGLMTDMGRTRKMLLDTEKRKLETDPEYQFKVKQDKRADEQLALSRQRLDVQRANAAKQGQTIRIGPDGEVVISEGGSGVNELTKPTQNKVQKDLLAANDAISRVSSIVESFDPGFLTLQGKVGKKIDWAKDFVGIPLDPETQESFDNYNTFQRRVKSDVASVLHELSGAAITKTERKMIVGGRFDTGNSPSQFINNVKDVYADLRRVSARLNYVRKNGLTSIEDIPLDRVDGIMERRAKEIEADVKKTHPEYDAAKIKSSTLEILSDEFGVRY